MGAGSPPLVVDHARLSGEWLLWRDIAVRTAGFPVTGLEAFGGDAEARRLQDVAAGPLFREAVTWQNPAAVANALDKVAAGPSAKGSTQRRREETVAGYWQRYCAKNDTIGFFGPLAWGRVRDDGPPLRARVGELISRRDVHLEAWGVQALAEALDPDLRVPTGLRAEDDLRVLLEGHDDADVRDRGRDALGHLEAARDAVAAAPPERLGAALAALDETFVELTGRAPTRNAGRAYGARTLSYVDCMRDLDVELGPSLLAELAGPLRLVMEAGRWYCGRVQSVAREVVERALPAEGHGPFGPVLGQVMPAMMQLPEPLHDEVLELQRRIAELLADDDPTTLGERAGHAFADHEPAWPFSVYQSVDVQIAARDEAAIAAGDFLAVIGDIHPGDNPLWQALFGARHPNPERFFEMLDADAGSPRAVFLPPWGPGLQVDARGVPLPGPADVVVEASAAAVTPLDRRGWPAGALLVDGTDVVDRSGRLRVGILDVLALPIFVMAVRTFELFPDADHMSRLTIGRTVVRRETWHPRAADIPADDVGEWARALGMPRRVFAKSPLERKPFYVDLDSRTLTTILRRQARQAAAADPEARMAFTEMLPTPEQCWLQDDAGERYACELRMVGVSPTT